MTTVEDEHLPLRAAAIHLARDEETAAQQGFERGGESRQVLVQGGLVLAQLVQRQGKGVQHVQEQAEHLLGVVGIEVEGQQLLGEVKASGPLDLAKKEGRLKFEVASIDRQVRKLDEAILRWGNEKILSTETQRVGSASQKFVIDVVKATD